MELKVFLAGCCLSNNNSYTKVQEERENNWKQMKVIYLLRVLPILQSCLVPPEKSWKLQLIALWEESS